MFKIKEGDIIMYYGAYYEVVNVITSRTLIAKGLNSHIKDELITLADYKHDKEVVLAYSKLKENINV